MCLCPAESGAVSGERRVFTIAHFSQIIFSGLKANPYLSPYLLGMKAKKKNAPPRGAERIPWHPAFFEALRLELEDQYLV
jgi:hypothetical protein